MNSEALSDTLTRAQVDALPGAILIEFGAEFCGHCRRAQPEIAAALQRFPNVRHLRIEDGPGQRLGRTFRVKLWPTLILMRDGQELARLVRPVSAEDIGQALEAIARPG